MVIQVIPALPLPRRLGLFDYEINDAIGRQLTPGMLVSVPFRHRQVPAVIRAIRNHSSIPSSRLRAISLTTLPPLAVTPEQLSFIDWLTNRYAVSPGLLLKGLALASLRQAQPEPRVLPQLQLGQPVQTIAAEGLTVVTYERESTHQSLLNQAVESTRRCLIVVPTLTHLEVLQQHFPQATVWHHEPLVKRRQGRLDQLAAAQLVIATRSILLQPLPRFELIILDDEDHEQHKQQDQQPQFHSLVLAVELGRRWHCPIIAFSPAPSMLAYHSIRLQPERWIRLTFPSQAQVQLLPRRFNQKAKGISADVMTLLDQALQRQERVFLLLNRRGLSRITLCQDCGWIARCPDCDTALTLYFDSLRCHRCGRTTTINTDCPNCHNPRLETALPGTAGLERELAHRYPGQLMRLDKDTQRPTSITTPLLIGTSFALPSLLRFQPDRVIVIGIDHVFTQPSSLGVERAWQLLRHLAALDSVKTMTVETRFAHQALWRTLVSRHVETFLQAEWENRQRHRLPPAQPTIAFEAKTPSNVARQTLMTWLSEQGVLRQHIKGPIDIFRGHKKTVRYLIEGSVEALFPAARLTSLPESWIIDPDVLA